MICKNDQNDQTEFGQKNVQPHVFLTHITDYHLDKYNKYDVFSVFRKQKKSMLFQRVKMNVKTQKTRTVAHLNVQPFSVLDVFEYILSRQTTNIHTNKLQKEMCKKRLENLFECNEGYSVVNNTAFRYISYK